MSDVMLLGVLRMPFDTNEDIHLTQLSQRCHEAAARIEADCEKIDKLEAEVKRLQDVVQDREPEPPWETERLGDVVQREIDGLHAAHDETLARLRAAGGQIERLTLALSREVERSREVEVEAELAELQMARDAVSAALYEVTMDIRFGSKPMAEDLKKYRDIHARLAKILGVTLPWLVEPEIERLREEVEALRHYPKGEVWYWQGNGWDFPASLTCPVIMRADVLRKMLAERTETAEAAKGAE